MAPVVRRIFGIDHFDKTYNEPFVQATKFKGKFTVKDKSKSGLVYGKDYQLQRVFLNLWLNAVQAVEDVPSPEITVEINTTESHLVMSVSDNGAGIEDDIKNDLFKQGSTTRELGIGFGLFIACSIVQNHGGRIEVEPAPQSGARFVVWLPLATDQ